MSDSKEISVSGGFGVFQTEGYPDELIAYFRDESDALSFARSLSSHVTVMCMHWGLISYRNHVDSIIGYGGRERR